MKLKTRASALTALLSPLFLTACAPTETPAHLSVPAPLLTCAAEPEAPAAGTGDRELADWILDLRSAGSDCRTKLNEVGGILASEH